MGGAREEPAPLVAVFAAIFSTSKPDMKPMFEAATKPLNEQPGDAQFCRTMGFVRFAAGDRAALGAEIDQVAKADLRPKLRRQPR
jgi:hypothetical protein